MSIELMEVKGSCRIFDLASFRLSVSDCRERGWCSSALKTVPNECETA